MSLLRFAFACFTSCLLVTVTLAQDSFGQERTERHLDRFKARTSVPEPLQIKAPPKSKGGGPVLLRKVTGIIDGEFLRIETVAGEPIGSNPDLKADTPIDRSAAFVVRTTQGAFQFPGVFGDSMTSGDQLTPEVAADIATKRAFAFYYYLPYIKVEGALANWNPAKEEPYHGANTSTGNAIVTYLAAGKAKTVRISKAQIWNAQEADGGTLVFYRPYGSASSGDRISLGSMFRQTSRSYSISVTHSHAPYGNDLGGYIADSVGAYNWRIFQSTRHGSSGSKSDTTVLHGQYQMNSDYDPVQVVWSIDNTMPWGSTYGLEAGVEFDRAALWNGIDAALSLTYETGPGAASGPYSVFSLSTDSSKMTMLYWDYQFKSQVEGSAAWDAGFVTKITHLWKLKGEYGQGRTYKLSLSAKY